MFFEACFILKLSEIYFNYLYYVYIDMNGMFILTKEKKYLILVNKKKGILWIKYIRDSDT